MKGEAIPFSYCISCWNNSEETVIQQIQSVVPNIVSIIPLLEKTEKKNGKWYSKMVKLTPGYIFLYSYTDIPMQQIQRISKLCRVLFYMEKKDVEESNVQARCYSLAGEDQRFALWLLRNSGVIKVSTAIVDNEKRFIVVDGPMKDFAENIKRIDKHNRKALVSGFFNKEKMDIWMSFDWDNNYRGTK